MDKFLRNICVAIGMVTWAAMMIGSTLGLGLYFICNGNVALGDSIMVIMMILWLAGSCTFFDGGGMTKVQKWVDGRK